MNNAEPELIFKILRTSTSFGGFGSFSPPSILRRSLSPVPRTISSIISRIGSRSPSFFVFSSSMFLRRTFFVSDVPATELLRLPMFLRRTFSSPSIRLFFTPIILRFRIPPIPKNLNLFLTFSFLFSRLS